MAVLCQEQPNIGSIYGLIKVDYLVKQLIQHGKPADEYVAIIENGTRESMRTLTGQLQQLPDMIKQHLVQSPALIVIGAVTQYAQQLDWFVPQTPYLDNTALLKTA